VRAWKEKTMTLRFGFRAGVVPVLLLGVSLVGSAVAFAQAPSTDVTGTWQLSCKGRRGAERQITVQLKQDGTQLSGTYSFSGKSGALTGSVQGDQVSFGAGQFGFKGTLSGNSLTGKGKRGRSCSGTRQ
jgi:hypothetical protein